MLHKVRINRLKLQHMNIENDNFMQRLDSFLRALYLSSVVLGHISGGKYFKHK